MVDWLTNGLYWFIMVNHGSILDSGYLIMLSISKHRQFEHPAKTWCLTNELFSDILWKHLLWHLGSLVRKQHYINHANPDEAKSLVNRRGYQVLAVAITCGVYPPWINHSFSIFLGLNNHLSKSNETFHHDGGTSLHAKLVSDMQLLWRWCVVQVTKDWFSAGWW